MLTSNCCLCCVGVGLDAAFVVFAVVAFGVYLLVVADVPSSVSQLVDRYCRRCHHVHANDFASVDLNSHNFACPITLRSSNSSDFGAKSFSQSNYFDYSTN